MKCVVCKNGEINSGTATVTLERDNLILVVKGVPARVCENCGEEYLDEAETSRLLESAEEAAGSGVRVDVRDYVAA
jgi:YgiT-type zinc finger domain-containing protein